MTSSEKTLGFLCIGAQKAGTTALHHYLAQHPQICLPAVKETHFFNNGHGEFGNGLAFYLNKYFSKCGASQVCGEIDPEYLYFPEAIPRLFEAFPQAKLIFMFRDPIARAYSHYWMTVRRGREPLSFEAAIRAEAARMTQGHLAMMDYSYVSRGLYFQQLKHCLDFYPHEQMLFLLSDDLKSRRAETLQTVCDFIGVPTIEFDELSDEQSHQAFMPRSRSLQHLVEGESRLRRLGKALLPESVRRPLMNVMFGLQARNRQSFEVPPLDPGTRRHLVGVFEADTRALEQLIGRDLGSWCRA